MLTRTDLRSQGAPAVAALMAYLQALLSVGGLQQPVRVGLAVHAELVPRLWYSFLRVRCCVRTVTSFRPQVNNIRLAVTAAEHRASELVSTSPQHTHTRHMRVSPGHNGLLMPCLSVHFVQSYHIPDG